MSNIHFAWLRGVEDKDKEDIINLVKNNSRYNKMILKILSEEYDQVEKKGDREDDYKEAGILSLLAFRNGQMSMLKRLAEYFDQKD